MPTDYADVELLDVNAPSTRVSIYVFDISYYREQDMKQYGKHDLFAVEKGKVISDEEFRKKREYRDIIKSIEKFRFPATQSSPGQLKTVLDILNDDEKN
jgi:hypothetical protein